MAHPPGDDVTPHEWWYLRGWYPAAQAAEKRDQLALIVRRLRGRGRIVLPDLHRVILRGMTMKASDYAARAERKGKQQINAAKARARRDLEQALARLRDLLPAGFPPISDDELFTMREDLLAPRSVPPTSHPKGGRPWEAKRETDDALRALGVGASDRRELLSAIGFRNSNKLDVIWFAEYGSRFEHGTVGSNLVGYAKSEMAAEYRRTVTKATSDAMFAKAKAGPLPVRAL